LIGYCFQIRLLSCEALPEGFESSFALLQHSCVLLQNGSIFPQRSFVLLLSRLNILQRGADGGISSDSAHCVAFNESNRVLPAKRLKAKRK